MYKHDILNFIVFFNDKEEAIGATFINEGSDSSDRITAAKKIGVDKYEFFKFTFRENYKPVKVLNKRTGELEYFNDYKSVEGVYRNNEDYAL